MNKQFPLLLSALLLVILFFLTGCTDKSRLYVGRFAKPGEESLYIYELNKRKAELKLLNKVDAGPSPSFICFSEERGLIYAANEVMEFRGIFGGGVTTIRYDRETGAFEKINEINLPHGGPCHISMSSDEDYLFVANYPNGSVVVIRLDENGVPEKITDVILYVRESPYESNAHMIMPDPAGKRVYVTDLGLDRIVIYNFDRINGKLIELENGIVNLPSKSGPRHFTFNESGSILYLINELGSSVMVFQVDENEGLKLLQTLPTTREGYDRDNYCADIHIGKDGRFLYGSNRGENSIVVYRIEKNGILSPAGHFSCGGDWPRNFAFDPSGKFLIVGNQKSDYISLFRINRKTGFPDGESKNYEIRLPVFHKFVIL